MLLERQPQLQQMDALLADAMGGRGRVVVVLGEAGAGKTALVEAFASRLDDGLTMLRSACEDLSIPDPLGPLYDLARDARWELPRAMD
ncbi:MAG: helix-turn-helix transcriptional regulator, partial [Mesorhizobium sp.]